MLFLDSILAIIDRFHADLKGLADSIRYHADKAAEPSKVHDISPLLTVTIPEGIENRKSASDKKDDTDYQTKTLFWQRLTFISLVVYSFFTFLIYWTNHTSADAAKQSANTADSTLKWTQQEFRLEQRPYLSPEARGGTSLPGGKTAIIARDRTTGKIGFAVAIDLRNIGKSPAIETEATPSEYLIGPRDDVGDRLRNISRNIPRTGDR